MVADNNKHFAVRRYTTLNFVGVNTHALLSKRLKNLHGNFTEVFVRFELNVLALGFGF